MSNVELNDALSSHLKWNVVKAPMFSNKIQVASNLKEYRAAFAGSPVYQCTMAYEFLREASAFQELQYLIGFFNARLGNWDSWLFKDRGDYAVTNQAFGVGHIINPIDPSLERAFLLSRQYGGFTERVSNLVGTPLIYADNILQTSPTDYTLDSTGLVTFVDGVDEDVVLTWTGEYRYRCRFVESQMGFNNFMYQLWEAQEFSFMASLGVKI